MRPAASPTAPDEIVVYAKYNRSRLPAFRTETTIVRSAGGLSVRKRALSPEGVAHLSRVAANHEACRVFAPVLEVPRGRMCGDVLELPYVEGRSLEELLWEAAGHADARRVDTLLSQYVEKVRSLSTPCSEAAPLELLGETAVPGERRVSPGCIDLTFGNLIVDPAGTWWLIDIEWLFEDPVPEWFVLCRSLELLLARRSAPYREAVREGELFARLGIAPEQRDLCRRMEERFQTLVRGPGLPFAIDPSHLQTSRNLSELHDELGAASRRAEEEARSAQARARQLEEERTRSRDELDTLSRESAERAEELARAIAREHEQVDRADRLAAELHDVRRALEASQESLRDWSERVRALEAESEELRRRLEGAEGRAAASGRRVDALRSQAESLLGRTADLTAEVETASRERDQLRSAVTDLERERPRLEAEVETASRERDRLRSALADLERERPRLLECERELHRIYGSRVWRVVSAYYRLAARFRRS